MGGKAPRQFQYRLDVLSQDAVYRVGIEEPRLVRLFLLRPVKSAVTPISSFTLGRLTLCTGLVATSCCSTR